MPEAAPAAGSSLATAAPAPAAPATAPNPPANVAPVAPVVPVVAGAQPPAAGVQPPAGAPASAPAATAPAAGTSLATSAGAPPVAAPPAAVTPTAPAAEADYSKLALPEKSQLSADDLKAVAEFAKTNKVAPEAAQKLLDAQHSAIERSQAKLVADHQERTKLWALEVRNHATLGGEKFTETMVNVKRVMDTAQPAIRKLMDDSGFGNHPAVIEFLADLGKRMAPDVIRTGSDGKPPAGTVGEAAPLNDAMRAATKATKSTGKSG